MGKVTDLSIYANRETLEMRLSNGDVLHLKQPTMRTLAELNALIKELQDAVEPMEQFEGFARLCLFILNTNAENKKISSDVVDSFYPEEAQKVVQDYLTFKAEIENNPNS